MGIYEDLKAAIQQVIRTNGNNEITGALLQQTLLSIVNSVGENAAFAGIATPNTNPGTADQNVYYLATEPGTYANFGGIQIAEGEAVILSNKTGNWTKTTSGFATQQQLTELESVKLQQGFILVSDTIPNFDTENHTLSLGDDPVLRYGQNGYVHFMSIFPNNPELYQSIDYMGEVYGSSRIIVFDTNNNEFSVILWGDAMSKSQVFICEVRTNWAGDKFKGANCPFPYTINGKKTEYYLWDNIVNSIYPAIGMKWEVGGVDGNSGNNTNYQNAIRTKDYLSLYEDNVSISTVPPTEWLFAIGQESASYWIMRIVLYDKDKNRVGSKDANCLLDLHINLTDYPTAKYVRFVFSQQETMNISDIPYIFQRFNIVVNGVSVNGKPRINLMWELGNYNSDGTKWPYTDIMRSQWFEITDKQISLSTSIGAIRYFVFFDENGNFITRVGDSYAEGGKSTINLSDYPNAKYVAFMAGTTNGTDIDNIPQFAKDAGIKVSGVSEIKKKVANKYMHISFDDAVFWKNLILYKDTYTSIFNNEVLAYLKHLHDSYGAVFTMNCFCSDGGYSIANVPDKFQSEFKENSSWLKFSFHAEDSETRYDIDNVDVIKTSYDTFTQAIFTMTGTIDTIAKVVRLGWFTGTLNNVIAIRDCNCGIVGITTPDDTRIGYYFDENIRDFMLKHPRYWDADNQLMLIKSQTRVESMNNPKATLNQFNSIAKGSQAPYLEIFTHEYEFSAVKTRLADICEWAVINGYTFDYWQNVFHL